MLRLVFHLPLRQAEGFLKSILKLMDLNLPCPDHTTVSRRNRTLNVNRCTGSLPDGPVHFIVDSTDLKICGQGEWHSKKHGERQRKRWKKLHLGVDENGRILASKVRILFAESRGKRNLSLQENHWWTVESQE